MTGVQRPWLWSLPARVELAEGAVIKFEERQRPGIELSQSQIDKVFEVGLMQPPRTSDRAPDSGAGVTLDGDAKFLVGEVDLGPEVGLEVLVRGLEVAIDASYREHSERHPLAEADDDDGGDTGPGDGAFDEPDLLGSVREVIIPVDEAGARLDDLLDEVQQGARIVFVRGGKRVAVMTSWPAYVGLREKSAGLAAAYWAAWRTGTFDATGYATDMTRIFRRHPGTPTPPSGDDRRTPEGGDGR